MSAIGVPGFPSFPAGGFFGVTGSQLGDLGPGLIMAVRGIQAPGTVKNKTDANGAPALGVTYSKPALLTPDVTVEERHSDRITITQHPVEKTASITDHAFKEPPTVTIRCGWSASSPSAQGDPNYPKTIYQQLLAFQDTVTLLSVMTGKRQYLNMLLSEIEVVTDQSAEYALMAVLTFQYVILVETQVTNLPANDVQAAPASTGSTVNLGTQNLKTNAVPNESALQAALANGSSVEI